MQRFQLLKRSLVMAQKPLRFQPFSASVCAFSHGQTDPDLSHKLSKEFKYENESAESIPSIIEEFKSKGVWKIDDQPGRKEVVLTQTFGNEQIKVFFSTEAVNEMREEESEEGGIPTELPLTVVITKPGQKGSLDMEVTATDNEFFLESVSYFEDPKMALDPTAQGDYARSDVYGGPVFQELDEGLQENFSLFLEERGFNDALAEFIPAYLEFKEQNEYVRWLKNVEEFVAN